MLTDCCDFSCFKTSLNGIARFRGEDTKELVAFFHAPSKSLPLTPSSSMLTVKEAVPRLERWVNNAVNNKSSITIISLYELSELLTTP